MERPISRDERVVNWQQARISHTIQNREEYLKDEMARRRSSVLGRVLKIDVSRLERTITATEQANTYIASPEFRDAFMTRKPWKLDEHSVDTGKNLYVSATKGYASHDFLQWVNDTAQHYDSTHNSVIAGVIESLRKIQWETVKIMVEKGVATNPTLPHILLANNPEVDIRLFQMALNRSKKKKDTRGLYSRQSAKDNLSVPEAASISKKEKDIASTNSLGFHVLGVCGENIVSIDSSFIAQTISDPADPLNGIDKLITVVVEEEVHHQRYKTREMEEARKRVEREYGTILFIPFIRATLATRIEEQVGLKEFVEEVITELPSQDDLLQPLYSRLTKTSYK